MKDIKKIGYLNVPISYGIDRLPELMSEFKKEHKINNLLANVETNSDNYVTLVMYSDKRSFSQDYFTDGLIHCIIGKA